jgi:hypothetical protein
MLKLLIHPDWRLPREARTFDYCLERLNEDPDRTIIIEFKHQDVYVSECNLEKLIELFRVVVKNEKMNNAARQAFSASLRLFRMSGVSYYLHEVRNISEQEFEWLDEHGSYEKGGVTYTINELVERYRDGISACIQRRFLKSLKDPLICNTILDYLIRDVRDESEDSSDESEDSSDESGDDSVFSEEEIDEDD